MLNPEQHRPDQRLSAPRDPAVAGLQAAVRENLKEAYANWLADIMTPSIENHFAMTVRMSEVQQRLSREASPILDKIQQAVEDSIVSEVSRRALEAEPGVADEDVAKHVLDKLEHEVAIINSEARRTDQAAAALYGNDPSKQRKELLSQCRRGLEFALGEEPMPVFFDYLRPVLNGVRCLGVDGIVEQLAGGLEEYRRSTRFRAVIFERMLSAVLADDAATQRTLAGLSSSETLQVIRKAAYDTYPTRSDYQEARGKVSVARGQLINYLVDTLEKSGNQFAITMALLLRAGPAQEMLTPSPQGAVEREVSALYDTE